METFVTTALIEISGLFTGSLNVAVRVTVCVPRTTKSSSELVRVTVAEVLSIMIFLEAAKLKLLSKVRVAVAVFPALSVRVALEDNTIAVVFKSALSTPAPTV